MESKEAVLWRSLKIIKNILPQNSRYQYIFIITDHAGKVFCSYGTNDELMQHYLPGMNLYEQEMWISSFVQKDKNRRNDEPCLNDKTSSNASRFYSLSKPFNDETGRKFGHVVFICDDMGGIHLADSFVNACVKFIENQFRSDMALKEMEVKNKFETAIMNSIQDGFLVLYPDGVIYHANDKAAKTLKLKPEELLGRKLTDFLETKSIVMTIFETGEAIVYKEIFPHIRGRGPVHMIITAVPVHDEEGNVIAVMENAREIEEVRSRVNQMVGARASFSFQDIIYKSKVMASAIKMATAAARGPLPILLQGESGTGKELFAHSIHNASTRCSGPFVIIDCSSIPRDLVESELFGYVEGAFTGASKGGRQGKFELANKGTVFLDEIGELPLEMQAKFLRVLQNKCFTKVGSSKQINVDIRIIAATNHNLMEEVQNRNFREDLYYRLSVVQIDVPPLRERMREDIFLLTEYFVHKFEDKLGKKQISISKEAMRLLEKYSWPGNVRELENAIGRAVNFCNAEIHPEHLPKVIKNNTYGQNEGYESDLSQAEFEKREISAALQMNKGNRARAARYLGIARSTLYKRMEYFNLK